MTSCNLYGVTLHPGITEKDAQDALVIYLCLYEIERSDLFGASGKS